MSNITLDDLIDRYETANFTVTTQMEARIKELIHEDITLDQFSTLRHIHKRGSCTSSELSDIFCVGKSSITAIITRLFDKNYIERIADSHDRRIVMLSLTDEGREIYKNAESKINSLISTFLIHFDEEEIKTFIHTYEKLAKLVSLEGREDK